MANQMHTDVLIIGAGPAGLMAAMAMAKLGIDFQIVDRRLPGEIASHADGIQPRTMEIMDSLGIGDEFRRLGVHLHRMALYGYQPDLGITVMKEVENITEPSVRYPYELILPSELIEGILRNGFETERTHVMYETMVTHLEVSCDDLYGGQYPVKTTVHRSESSARTSNVTPEQELGELCSSKFEGTAEEILSKFVIACDGSHSFVRRFLGIGMQGERTATQWGVVDFTPRTNLPTPRAKNIILTQSGTAIGWIPRPHATARAYVNLGARTDASVSDTDVDSIDQVIRNGVKPYSLSLLDVTRASTYVVTQCVATAFSHNKRIFLAGDACHTHSPNSGQGANVSMGDTYNLAWKIAGVLRGSFSLSLLDTYERERQMFARDLIEFDKEMFKIVAVLGSSSLPLEYAELWHKHNMFTTGVGIQYSSTLTRWQHKDLAPGICLGARLPIAEIIRNSDWRPFCTLDLLIYDGRFKLLLFAGDVADDSISEGFSLFTLELEKLRGSWSSERKEIITIIAIIKARKDSLLHKAAWHHMTNNMEVYLDTDRGPYSLYGIKRPVSVLVRPDGHTAQLTTLDKEGITMIHNYFENVF